VTGNTEMKKQINEETNKKNKIKIKIIVARLNTNSTKKHDHMPVVKQKSHFLSYHHQSINFNIRINMEKKAKAPSSG